MKAIPELPRTVADDADPPKPSIGERWGIARTSDVDPERAQIPLLFFCGITGYVDAVVYTTHSWSGFQTGNTIQLSIALARTFSGPQAPTTSGLQPNDQFALVSLLSFSLGAAFLQVGHFFGIVERKIWHCSASLMCAVLTLVASMCLVHGTENGLGNQANLDSSLLAWSGARGLAIAGLLAASLGLQGAIASRLGTPFATTVVLTSLYLAIFSQPSLYHFRRVRSRDQRIYAIACLFIGGFIGRSLLGAIGDAATLGIAAGLRALAALTWLWVPTLSSVAL